MYIYIHVYYITDLCRHMQSCINIYRKIYRCINTKRDIYTYLCRDRHTWMYIQTHKCTYVQLILHHVYSKKNCQWFSWGINQFRPKIPTLETHPPHIQGPSSILVLFFAYSTLVFSQLPSFQNHLWDFCLICKPPTLLAN